MISATNAITPIFLTTFCKSSYSCCLVLEQLNTCRNKVNLGHFRDRTKSLQLNITKAKF